ncbi:MAG: hypothetical protein RID53_24225 [Coleofasciculus sp. B1-GNL1-01]|uniref:hypothetical protein n=1 Tax=Coleofasciculus sp. B1-GNL1-01 TaxID=3068484 RepID=UPI0032FA1B90
MALSVENLFELADHEVKSNVTTGFTNMLQNAGNGVRNVFFPNPPSAISPKNVAFVNDVACAFICSAISYSSRYNFANCVNRGRADDFWKRSLTQANANCIAEGSHLYTHYFLDYCRKDETTFRMYQEDGGSKWAKRLHDAVVTAPFINAKIVIIFEEPNWLENLNLIFFKLHQLDPSYVQSTLDRWKVAYPDKGIIAQWEKFHFIPYPNFTHLPKQFMGNVNNAISKKTQTGKTFIPAFGGPGAAMASGYIYDYAYGKAVADWLAGRPNQLGFRTSTNYKNTEIEDHSPAAVIGRSITHGCCFVKGTKIKLANGEEKTIEHLAEGDNILTKDGQIAFYSDEKIIIKMPHNGVIYGIDDGLQKGLPFFTGHHLFWARDISGQEGWKAIFPDDAKENNPSLKVGKLQSGDTIFRLKSFNLVEYQEVRIKDFTKAVIQEGDFIFGLHLLDGDRSYHANGYIVGNNYPIITLKRIRDGFKKLSEVERKHLADSLQDILPTAEIVFGRNVTRTLDKYLNQHISEPQSVLPQEIIETDN